MTIRHGLGLAAVTAGVTFGIAGVGWAGPAHAAPIGEEEGTYEITFDGASQGTWAISPCGSGCARIASDSGWTNNASLVGGQWSFSRVKDEAVQCQDGSTGAGSIVYAWPAQDADAITGTVTTTSAEGACGDSSPNTGPAKSFTLTKVG